MNDERRPASRGGIDLTDLLAALRATAAERDRAGGHAADEKRLIADAGLLTLTVPKPYGGQGASWEDVYAVVRSLATVDSALAHLLGFSFLQLVGVEVWGTEAQRARYLRGTVGHRWWWGNAVNPLDPRLVAHATGTGGYRVSGQKGFCSGTRGSNMMTLSAQDPATGKPVFAVVPTDRAGITVHEDWNAIGQRQTDSGSVSFADVEVAADEVLHRSERAPSPRATLRSLVSQLVLTNLFVGIAQGALAEAVAFFNANARPWIHSGVSTATEDPYQLHRFAEMRLKAIGAEMFATRAAQSLDAAWRRGDSLTVEERGKVAVDVADARVLAHRAALDVSEAVFDACGARSTHGALALDRFWRNARVHTLHDPLDYKLRDLGRFALTGTIPEPTLYG